MARWIVVFLCTTVVFCAAGSYFPTESTNTRIVDGKNANIEDFPYMAEITRNGYHKCGGVIVGKDVMLTAATCLEYQNPEELEIRVGSTKLDEMISSHIIWRQRSHEQYDWVKNRNDIAFIEVHPPFPIGQKGVQAIPMADEGDEFPVGTPANFTGWGQSKIKEELGDDEPYNNVLQKQQANVVDFDECNNFYKNLTKPLSDTIICAGTKIDCSGDFGGPLVSNGKVIGIMTRLWNVQSSTDCGKQGYGAYTKISAVRSWIRKNIDI